MDRFELTMTIKEGFSSLATTSAYHVETSVEGVHKVEDNTAEVKMTGGVAVWNKKIVKTFRMIESPIPIIVSMSMYKKKTFQTGHKLVGTAHFALADLLKILNNPSVCGKISLNVKKHHLATSHLVIELQLRSINAVSAMQSLPLSFTKTALSPIPSSPTTGACTDIEEGRPVKSQSKSPAVIKQQLYSTSSRGPAPGKTAGSSRSDFSVWHLLVAIFVLAVMTCSTYQLMVR
jgi:hypothetical protein